MSTEHETRATGAAPPAVETRKELLERELDRYVRVLTEHGDPHKILVFGSLVTGSIHAWSDIDLVVVQDTELPFWQRLRQTRKLLHPQVGTDILVYTPEEFEKLRRDRPFFQEEIVSQGEVIYERND